MLNALHKLNRVLATSHTQQLSMKAFFMLLFHSAYNCKYIFLSIMALVTPLLEKLMVCVKSINV